MAPHGVRFLPEARADVRVARRWYDRQTPGLGLEFARAVAATAASVGRSPEMYPVVEPPTRRALLRRFPYALLYDVGPDGVVVHGCFHLHRDPEAWRSRGAG